MKYLLPVYIVGNLATFIKDAEGPAPPDPLALNQSGTHQGGHSMKKSFVLAVSLLLFGCVHHSASNPITINTEIISTSAGIFNNATDAATFKKVTGWVEDEIRNRLRKEGVETVGQGPAKATLVLDYEALESDSSFVRFNQACYTAKGRFKLIDATTKNVLVDEEFRQSEPMLTDLKYSISEDVVRNIDRHLE